MQDPKELTRDESAMTLYLHSGLSNRYYLEKDSKVVVDVSYSAEDNGAVLNVEDDDGVLNMEDDDGVSSVEDDHSSTEDDDGVSSVEDDSSTEDDDGGSSVEGYDCGSSTDDDDGDLSVEAALARDLAYWEAMEWVPEPERAKENVVEALHIVRCQEFTEVDPKLGFAVPTRFCEYNIALFDFEKEFLAGLGPLFSTLTESEKRLLETSINIVSVKVLESDVGCPISVFGTILARDDVDFKSVYLFRRSRDSPQIITSPVNVF